MTDSTEHRYRAFISYSKLDQQHAKRLHSALETYRVPKGIDAKLQRDRRLGRFFRDDDEMGASTDLGATLRDALDSSENLILICSPHSARSRWVNAEVLHFKNTSAADRIFAVVVEGVPQSDNPELNCFPPALTSQTAGEELLSKLHSEPLAIDLRKESFQRSRIRLVAGLLGISFDSLWQRERRRTMKRRAIAAVVTVALASVIVVLGINWLTARGRVHAQRIDRTLVKVRDDLASERVSAGLTELDSLTAGGEQGAVEDLLKSTLSWVSTPSELLKELKSPGFFTNGSQLYFLAADGSRHLLSINRPYRRILTSDKRHLLILTNDEAVVLNVADGRELARTASKGIEWKGHTFETRTGLLIVGGRYFGMTTGSMRCAFLVFSRQQQSLSLFNDNPIHEANFEWMAVSPGCANFGIVHENAASKELSQITSASDLFIFTADSSGLKPLTMEGSVADWRGVQMFSSLAEDLLQISDGAGEFPSAGCVAPNSDSATREPQSGATGLFRPIGLGTFWESERRWKVVRDKVEPQYLDEPGTAKPCEDERPCRVQNPTPQLSDDGSFPGWDKTLISNPRGVHNEDRSFEAINNEAVHFGYSQHAGGVIAAWCRGRNCFVTVDIYELEHEEMLDLRSNTGRLIFNPRGLMKGFQLYDLSTMRDVSPKGTELVAGTQQADFSPKDERLFVAANGRLLVFTPPTDGGPWQLVSDPASIPIPALSGNKDEKIAGLLALDDNHLLVVSSSGVISRFDWRTGQQLWTRTISSVAEVYRVVVSKNRRFILIIGTEGGRLVDTVDGLVLSGTLVPPNAMDGRAEMLKCFDQAFVTDTGAIELLCGDKEYSRDPIAFSGNMRTRLQEIFKDGSANGSN
ncbi:MAG TPA: TIR domain-containing protein [Pyrinomonadaceae bacterium]|nr:TIR domain-containing protein [Pyrinomonadaceae bacterium]